MWSYSLDLDRPGEEPIYVPSHDFPDEVHAGDRFKYDGWTWQVTAIATKQFNAGGQPGKTLRCVVV